jgi:hypothetical protein
MYDVNLNLNLNPHSEQVFLRGYPGAKIDYIKERVSSRDRTKINRVSFNIKILLSCTKSGSFADFTSAMA